MPNREQLKRGLELALAGFGAVSSVVKVPVFVYQYIFGWVVLTSHAYCLNDGNDDVALILDRHCSADQVFQPEQGYAFSIMANTTCISHLHGHVFTACNKPAVFNPNHFQLMPNQSMPTGTGVLSIEDNFLLTFGLLIGFACLTKLAYNKVKQFEQLIRKKSGGKDYIVNLPLFTCMMRFMECYKDYEDPDEEPMWPNFVDQTQNTKRFRELNRYEKKWRIALYFMKAADALLTKVLTIVFLSIVPWYVLKYHRQYKQHPNLTYLDPSCSESVYCDTGLSLIAISLLAGISTAGCITCCGGFLLAIVCLKATNKLVEPHFKHIEDDDISGIATVACMALAATAICMVAAPITAIFVIYTIQLISTGAWKQNIGIDTYFTHKLSELVADYSKYRYQLSDPSFGILAICLLTSSTFIQETLSSAISLLPKTKHAKAYTTTATLPLLRPGG